MCVYAVSLSFSLFLSFAVYANTRAHYCYSYRLTYTRSLSHSLFLSLSFSLLLGIHIYDRTMCSKRRRSIVSLDPELAICYDHSFYFFHLLSSSHSQNSEATRRSKKRGENIASKKLKVNSCQAKSMSFIACVCFSNREEKKRRTRASVRK